MRPLNLKSIKIVLTEGSQYRFLLVSGSKILYLLKKIFFPSFIYEFSLSLPSNLYIEKANATLESFGAKILSKKSDSLSFYISASRIRMVSYGKLLIHVRKTEVGDYNFRIEFVTHKVIFYFIVLLLSLFIVISAATSHGGAKMVAIPFIFSSGHIYFWGMLPSGVTKIKRFLMKLDDGYREHEVKDIGDVHKNTN